MHKKDMGKTCSYVMKDQICPNTTGFDKDKVKS